MVCVEDLVNEKGQTLWIENAPPPDHRPNEEHSVNGNAMFYAALAFILRHELAHVVLGHRAIAREDRILQEQEADSLAADWLRGERKADEARPASQAPTGEEKELEQRALAIVLGIVWIATFEIRGRQPSRVHPPIGDRIYYTLDRLQLREDSSALEIAAHAIQYLIDPQGAWSSSDEAFPTALDFLQEAVRRLHRYMEEISH